MKLRATIVIEYDADPDLYRTKDAQKMVETDTGPYGNLMALIANADSCIIKGEEINDNP